MPTDHQDELRTDDDGRWIRLEREYDAAPAEVWDAWTDPQRLSRWLGSVPRPFGDEPVRMHFGYGEDDWADLTVVRADEPSLLELRWGFPGEDASRLLVQIDDLGGGRTRVVVEHRGLGEATVGYGAGWTAYLAGLGIELGAPDDGRDWDTRFAAALPAWRQQGQRASSATG